MVKSFAKEVTTYISQGAPNVSTEEYINRLDACNTCPHLRKEKMSCGLCGCFVQHKAKWKTTKCPDNPTRWNSYDNG